MFNSLQRDHRFESETDRIAQNFGDQYDGDRDVEHGSGRQLSGETVEKAHLRGTSGHQRSGYGGIFSQERPGRLCVLHQSRFTGVHLALLGAICEPKEPGRLPQAVHLSRGTRSVLHATQPGRA